MKNRIFINRFLLYVLLAGFLLSFTTDFNILYISKADCESYEGVGNCAECNGGWHRKAACGLLDAMNGGDLIAKDKYIAIVRQEYLNYNNASNKAAKDFQDLKGTKVSSKVYGDAQKAAADAAQKAALAKADLDKILTKASK